MIATGMTVVMAMTLLIFGKFAEFARKSVSGGESTRFRL
jgi:hypothetical protein